MDDTAGLPDSDDDPRSDEDKAEVLAMAGDTLGAVKLVLAALRQAAKDDKRLFFQMGKRKDGTPRVALTDGPILSAIGYVKQGKPEVQWLDNIAAAEKPWRALCLQVVKVGREYGVEVVR